ncbi:hypothetical protein [Salinibacter ruber]|uniref:Uncharacterized protein n=1 Tax=Salinibacter ruber TaxID=146919 RepID=A0AAW5P8G8_9BACT|nr:hypothetical protein [Salinibacter ruber]MCS4157749.1 hypothetical protein [Salinibacter ruber]
MINKQAKKNLSDEAVDVLKLMKVPPTDGMPADMTREQVAGLLKDLAGSTALSRSDQDIIDQARQIKHAAQFFIDQLSERSVQADCEHRWKQESIPVFDIRHEDETREHGYEKCARCGLRKREAQD